MKKMDRKKVLFLVGSILGVLLITIGFTYAWFTLQLEGTKTNVIRVGNLALTIQNEANAINLTDAYPMSDEDGRNTTPYTFSLENTGNVKANYVLKLVDDTTSKTACTDCKFIPIDGIKYEFTVDSVSTVGILPANRTLYSGSIAPGTANKKEFSLRLWMDSSRDLGSAYQNASFFGKIEITAEQES